MTAKFDNCWFAAAKLFHEIKTEIGQEDARRIFKEIAGPPTKKQRAGWKNMELVTRYDCMERPSVRRLARELAEENRNLPREQRHGPTGSTEPAILDKHIRRLLANRRSKQGRQVKARPVAPLDIFKFDLGKS
jgi:hypothetical protein